MNNHGNTQQLSNEDVLKVSGGMGGANPPLFIDNSDQPSIECFTHNGRRVCARLSPPTQQLPTPMAF